MKNQTIIKKNIYKYIFGKKIYILKYKYINNQIYILIKKNEIPLVPHKAVAEVSEIGNL
jgi:hypothetical protein